MDQKERAALASVAASAALAAGKAVVGLSTGSLAILSEAAHSLIDLVATLMTYFAVRMAGKPADAEHHYGHGKVENVSALAETALLFVLSGIVAWEAGQRLWFGGAPVLATKAAFAVMLVSVAVDFFRARELSRIAKATQSQALEADALHFWSDLASSLAVLAGLAGVRWAGLPWADSAAALMVAVMVAVAGWRLGRRTFDTLTDTAPQGVAERIAAITRDVRHVASVERVRAREVGPTVFADIEVCTSRTLPLDRVAAMESEINAAVTGALPNVEISVSVVPRALDSETVTERVMVIAHNRTLAVHHVMVQVIGDQLSISLDLEVDGELSFAAAHDIADSLEAAIRDEFGATAEVETHLEPLQTRDLDGHDAPDTHRAAVATALTELAGSCGLLHNVHDVRVRSTSEGDVVHFHCDVDPHRTVTEVHDLVDGVEHGLRRRFPAVRRVIGHAEPRPSPAA